MDEKPANAEGKSSIEFLAHLLEQPSYTLLLALTGAATLYFANGGQFGIFTPIVFDPDSMGFVLPIIGTATIFCFLKLAFDFFGRTIRRWRVPVTKSEPSGTDSKYEFELPKIVHLSGALIGLSLIGWLAANVLSVFQESGRTEGILYQIVLWLAIIGGVAFVLLMLLFAGDLIYSAFKNLFKRSTPK